MKFAVAVILGLVVCGATADIILTTCARMDTPILEKVAAAACISSCKFQNCGTGSCQKRSGRPVCVCSRCGNGGGSWPVKRSVSSEEQWRSASSEEDWPMWIKKRRY